MSFMDWLNTEGKNVGTGFANFAGNLGMAGGAGGTNFAGPSATNANISAPLGTGQLAAANQAGINSVNGQQALLQALAMQGGLGAQNNVLNQQQAFGQQLNGLNASGNLQGSLSGQTQLANALANAGGLNAQQQAIAQQQALNQSLYGGVNAQNQALSGLQGVAGQQAGTAAQLQGIANGTGPNPAMAAINNATGQNVANQAALMASQRGAGANVGLLARQAAQQGAATQQNAVGQAAQMQAQQSLNALSALQAQQQAQAATQGQIGQLGTTQAGMQQAGIGNLGNLGAGLTGAQQAALAQQGNLAAQQSQLALQQAGVQQNALAQQGNLANTIAGQQIAGQTAATQAAQNEQQQQLAAQQAFNQTQAGLQQNVNTTNAGLAQTQMGTQKGLLGGLLSGGASVLGSAAGLGAGAAGGAGGAGAAGAAALAQGGEVKKYADGDMVEQAPITQPPAIPSAMPSQPMFGPQSSFARFLSGFNKAAIPAMSNSNEQMSPGQTQDDKNLESGAKKLGSALTSAFMAKGGKAHNLKKGGDVKATDTKEKAKVKGNSYSNDTIPAMLSEGEVVIPRSVMQSKDPVKSSADFVRAVLAKKGKKYG